MTNRKEISYFGFIMDQDEYYYTFTIRFKIASENVSFKRIDNLYKSINMLLNFADSCDIVPDSYLSEIGSFYVIRFWISAKSYLSNFFIRLIQNINKSSAVNKKKEVIQ